MQFVYLIPGTAQTGESIGMEKLDFPENPRVILFVFTVFLVSSQGLLESIVQQRNKKAKAKALAFLFQGEQNFPFLQVYLNISPTGRTGWE